MEKQCRRCRSGVIGSLPEATINRPIADADLIRLRNRYVALDDALCLVWITSLLERYRKPYRIRVERSTSFSDLRDTPAVLIGAFRQSVDSAGWRALAVHLQQGQRTLYGDGPL